MNGLKMKLIVCLGNPGSEYVKTRHNVGFRVGEELHSLFLSEGLSRKFKSLYCKGRIGNVDVVIMFPMTYMNLSGEAVQAALTWFKLLPSDMLVVYDDIDINFGTLRFRKQGGPGTHNGLRSITNIVKSNNFPRLRIGVGPAPRGPALANFVLSNFSKEEEEKMPHVLDASKETIITWINEGDDAAMRFSSAVTLI